MSKDFYCGVIAEPRMSKPVSLYEVAFAAGRAAIQAGINLAEESPAQAAEFVEALVRAIYGAGTALDLPLSVIHLVPETE